MSTPTPNRPAWVNPIQPGDFLTVRAELLARGGQQGEVLSADEKGLGLGLGLDFYCAQCPEGVPSQEFWEWSEIDLDSLPVHAPQARESIKAPRKGAI